MDPERFVARVQYGDLKGTAAADTSDQNTAERWLDKEGLRNSGEHLAGISVWIGENHGTHRDPIHVTFLLAETKVRTGEPLPVREVRTRMNLTDFFALFKRFSFAISYHGLLTDGEYTVRDE